MTTVMVTGVGAIIGYGILRSLRAAKPHLRLVGADLHRDAVGQAWCDVFQQAPRTDHPDYLSWLSQVADEYEIDLLIPGIEQDLHRLHAARNGGRLPCIVALNNPALIELSRDKWAMHQDLLARDDETRIPTLQTGTYDGLVTKFGLPFLLKPRCSYASKGLVRVNSRENFAPYASLLGGDLIAQPIVGSDDEEYTVGAFGDGQGNVCASISLRRTLAPDGSTVKAWVSRSPSLDACVARLSAHYRPLGPTNFQFRRDGETWKLLEINPRISSSTSIRAAFGYNEAAMCVGFYLHGEPPSQPSISDGFARRFIEDFIVFDAARSPAG